MDKLLLHQSTKTAINRLVESPSNAVGIEGAIGSGKQKLAEYTVCEILKINDIYDNPYVFVLDCSEKTGIDEVRQAINFLTLKIPGDLKYKRSLIFLSFESLGIPAQNALLKTLEEPPEDTVIVITSESRQKLLPTTVSRLSWIKAQPVSEQEALEHFSEKFSQNQIKNAFLLSDGRVGIMAEILKDYDNHPFVGAIETSKRLISMDRFDRLQEIEQLMKKNDFLSDIHIAAIAKIYESVTVSKIRKTNSVDARMIAGLEKIVKAQNSLQYNSNQKLIFTEMLYSI